MYDLKKIFDDNIINKENLLEKRYKFIGMSKQQAQLIKKLFTLKDQKNISFSQISEILELKKETTEILVKDLILNNFVLLNRLENGEYSINIEVLSQKLFNTYFFPMKNSNMDEKIHWLKNILEIDFNDENIDEIKKWIKSNQWNKILLVINGFLNLKDKKITWPLIVSSYESISSKDIKEDKNLKELIDVNWLEN